MNHYILIRRLTGPAILLLLGIVALLSEMHVAHFFIFVPLLLILLGVLKLAERAALVGYEYPASGVGPQQAGGAAQGNGPAYGAGPGYGTGPGYGASQGPGGPASTSSSIVPRFQEPGFQEPGSQEPRFQEPRFQELASGSETAFGESGEEKR